MDPNYGFNSPSVGPAKPVAGLSRPPRLAKIRKPMTGNRPNLVRPVSPWTMEDSSSGPGMSSSKPNFEPSPQNAGLGFVFASTNGGNNNLFSEIAMNTDPVRSNLVDELKKMKIETQNFCANSKYIRNISSSSSGLGTSSSVGLSGKGHSFGGVDESLVSELPDEMRELHIGNGHFGKGYVGEELQSKINKLNIKDYETDSSKNVPFGRNDNDSLGGSSGAFLPNKMEHENINDSLRARGETSSHLQSVAQSRQAMQSETMGEGISHSVPGSFASGFTFQGGLQSNNNAGQASYVDKNPSTKAPLFAATSPKPAVGGEKKVQFSFGSKLNKISPQNVEFSTPDPKDHMPFVFNWKGETKRDSAKETGLKKKKGKWKRPAHIPSKFGQNFVFQENLQNNSESSDQYSPMDVSPYEETLATDYSFSRETSVASEDSSLLDDGNSSCGVCPDAPSDLADEQLVSAAECLRIDDHDIRDSGGQHYESSSFVHEGIGVESSEGSVISGVETESFKSATDELEYSCDSFFTAADVELSSGSSIRRQDSGGRSQYDTSLPDVRQSRFIFSALSEDLSDSASSLNAQKKKNPFQVTDGIFSSSPSVDVSHASSSHFPFQVPGSLPLSPEQGYKGNMSSAFIRRKAKSEQVKELLTKQDSATAVSIAAQESCEKWRLRGNQAYAKGEFSKAEDSYTHGVNCISQSEASRSCLRALMLCYSNRAATRISLGRMREALQDCMKAATLDPNFLRVQVRAASCYLALGDVENATLHFMKCLQVGPDVCADRKLLIEASDGLQKAQKVAECVRHAQELLGRRTPCDVDSVMRLIAEGLSISSYSEKLLQMKVDTLLMLKKYEDIIKLGEQLLSYAESNFLTSGVSHSVGFHGSDIKRAPSFRVWCWSLILKSYFYLGKLEEALDFVKKQDESVSLIERRGSTTLESMIPLVGTIRELLRHKAAGNEAYQSGNHAEAVEHYTASVTCSVESRPFAAKCYCNRALAYRAMGQIIDALADCSLAIALDGNYLKAIARRASLYETIRDYGQAVTDLQTLVSLLTEEIDKKTNQFGPSDKLNCVSELRQTRVKLSEMEEASKKEIPLNMYLILGVDSTAAATDIRKAYRKAALKYHPDKAGQSLARNENPNDSIWKEIAEEVHKDADRLFKMIAEAYAMLSDPTKRSGYDLDEEVRKNPTRANGNSSTKMYSDFQNYYTERGTSRRNWEDVRRAYERQKNQYF